MPDDTQKPTLTQLSDHPNASIELVAAIVKLLEGLETNQQQHILQTVATWLRMPKPVDIRDFIAPISSTAPSTPTSKEENYPFSERPAISPKEFMLEKDPKTDVERLTCLAYYLTHYRDLPYFKTEDLSLLNTEAAQRKFSNAAFTAKNAVRDGFLVPAPQKMCRQLGAIGEQYVQALPDRDAAQKVRKRMKGRASRARNKPTHSDHTAANKS